MQVYESVKHHPDRRDELVAKRRLTSGSPYRSSSLRRRRLFRMGRIRRALAGLRHCVTAVREEWRVGALPAPAVPPLRGYPVARPVNVRR